MCSGIRKFGQLTIAPSISHHCDMSSSSSSSANGRSSKEKKPEKSIDEILEEAEERDRQFEAMEELGMGVDDAERGPKSRGMFESYHRIVSTCKQVHLIM